MKTPPTALADRILVTGARGFIGSRLCERLRDLGSEVHALSRSVAQGSRDGIAWWRVDAADADALKKTYAQIRPGAVFHMAGHVLGRRDLDLVGPTFRSNLASTVNLFAIAAEESCPRIVLPGSLEEPEGDPANAVPASPYAASKWASTAYARMFRALYGLPVVIARVFMVYGPGAQDERKLIPYVIRSLLEGEAPKLSSGRRAIDWIYLDDVVDGLIAAAGDGALEANRIDIGSGELITIRELVERIATLMGAEVALRFGDLAERPMEQVRRADVAATETLIGWKPRVPLDEGLGRTIGWYAARLVPGAPLSREPASNPTR